MLKVKVDIVELEKDKTLQKNQLVKYIEELRTIGLSYFKIADCLNDEGIKSKLNKKWYGSSVRMVLRNGISELYVTEKSQI